MTSKDKLERVNARSWYHSIEIEPGLVTPGLHPLPELQTVLANVRFPEDLTGQSVLDIGAFDGFFTFEAERRGARRVVAYDLSPPDYFGFATARDLLGSRAEYVQGSVYDLSPEAVGTFDVVLFLGVFYHLRYPLLALDRIREVCRGYLLLETHCLEDHVLLASGRVTTLRDIDPRLTEIPLYRFYRGDELNGDFSNWFAPNRRALEEGLWSAGFAPEQLAEWADRIAYKGWRIDGVPEYLRGTYEGVKFTHIEGQPLRNESVPSDAAGSHARAAGGYQPTSTCWCGGALGTAVGAHYRLCVACGAAVMVTKPDAVHFDVDDDGRDFYGRRYWLEYSRERGLPDIASRARGDLSERCVFWLERLLEHVRPPGRALEIGCGHGGFVRLLQELGFEATGTELSPWVVEFARRTFGVPVLRGRVESLDLAPGFRCIAAFDVLEHVDDPLSLATWCAERLAPDGVLFLQTPWYRGEGAEWGMFQSDEHVHLFTEESIRLLLTRAGFRDVRVEPALFPYDMWVAATCGRLDDRPGGDDRGAGWRMPVSFRALLDVARRADEALARADEALARATQLDAQVSDLTHRLLDAEKDGAARLAQIEELTAWLRATEADSAARFEQIQQLTERVRETEADSAARFVQIEELTGWLQDADADRAARLEVIHRLEGELARIAQTPVWRLYQVVKAYRKPGARG